MFALRRKAVQSVVSQRATPSICRYSTAQHGKTGDEAHHSTEHGHHHAGPVNESLGIQLYVVLGSISASYGLYLLSRDSKDGSAPFFTKVIDRYSYYQEKWAARNSLHVAMVEQAGFDRNLFQSDRGSAHIDLRFPEIFNTGSPWNVTAGQGGGNLDALVAHYEKVNAEAEDRKIKALAAKESK